MGKSTLLHKGNKYNIGKKLSEETRRKIGEAHKGNKYMLGRKLSEETKRKIGDIHRGKIVSVETRLKFIGNKWNVGRKHTLETREKVSVSRMGHPVSTETRSKLSIAAKKQWERKYECGHYVSASK